ncbi:hypothetical protein CGJ24_24085 [Vibrio parahaemolyticus]|nr:hypothetical protein CGJ24_24085 [Vibrio parahaemolyticus]
MYNVTIKNKTTYLKNSENSISTIKTNYDMKNHYLYLNGINFSEPIYIAIDCRDPFANSDLDESSIKIIINFYPECFI